MSYSVQGIGRSRQVRDDAKQGIGMARLGIGKAYAKARLGVRKAYSWQGKAYHR
jgi:hypothetical protein